jgi:hypothetical protein
VFRSKRNRWAAHLALIGKFRVAYMVLVGKPGFFVGKSEGKEPLGRSKLRRKGNNKLIFKKSVGECVNWIYL